jgi:hypothetical protein
VRGCAGASRLQAKQGSATARQRGPGLTTPCLLPLASRPTQLTERNPEFAQLLNNPEILRESMRVMSNPVRAGGQRHGRRFGGRRLPA